MYFRITFLALLLSFLIACSIHGQISDSVFMLTGTVYNASYQPVPATHVINLNTHAGAVSDSLGIFRLPVHPNDKLLFRNIVYMDTVVSVVQILQTRYMTLRQAYYPLEEVRIFEWGTTYGDFRNAIIKMPNQQTLGESMGLPRRDPDFIPYDMDEAVLESTAFLLTSPVSYFYHKYNKNAKSSRKVYWLEKNREKHDTFDAIISPESISEITGLSGEPLMEFMAYLFQRMVCDFKCTEFQVYSEIHGHWQVFQELNLPEKR
jgi:hypothetical protein